MANKQLPTLKQIVEELEDSAVDELRDIQGFQAIEIPTWVWVLLGLIALSLLLYLLLKLLRKSQEKPLSALERTILALKNLDLEKPSKEFYLEYSEIVKKYFEDTLGIAALDKTSEELRPLLKEQAVIRTDQVLLMAEILSRSDLAKFALRELNAESKAADIHKMIDILQDIDLAIIKRDEEAKQQSEIVVAEEILTGGDKT